MIVTNTTREIQSVYSEDPNIAMSETVDHDYYQ